MRITLLSILFGLTHGAYSQKSSSLLTENFVTDNYKIEYPESWRIEDSGSFDAELIILSPLENATDQFAENVNILIQDFSGLDMTLEKYKQTSERELIDFATDSKLFESSIKKSDKGDYFRMTYAMTQGTRRLKITAMCFIRNDKVFLVTFTSDIDKYKKYKKVGLEILDSFVLIK